MQSIINFFQGAIPWLFLGAGIAVAAVAWAGHKNGNRAISSIATATLLFAGALAAFIATSDEAQAQPIEPATGQYFMLGDDSFWAGNDLIAEELSFANDLLGAGQDFRINGCDVNGSIRIAGQDVIISNTNVAHSITVAGQDISIDGTTAQSMAFATQNLRFEGQAGSLFIAAEDVFINGKVDGNVTIYAKSLTIADDAVIDGNIIGTLESEPRISNAATVGDLNVTVDKHEHSKPSFSFSMIPSIAFAFSGFAFIAGLIGVMLVALLCELFARSSTAASAKLYKERTGAAIGTGVIAAIAAPFALIALCCLVITIPIAGALALVLFAITIIGEGFFAASIAQLAFKKMGRWTRVLAMSAIVGVVGAIPILGVISAFVGFAYLLGYVLQNIYLGMKRSRAIENVPTIEV